MWSIEYVQVPIEKVDKESIEKIDEKLPAIANTHIVGEEINIKEKNKTVKVDLVKQMSLSTQDSTGLIFNVLFLNINFFYYYCYNSQDGMLVKSGSESSISEACDSSIKETSKRYEVEKEKDECSDNETVPVIKSDSVDSDSTEKLKLTASVQPPRKLSMVSAKSLHELKHDTETEQTKKDSTVDSGNISSLVSPTKMLKSDDDEVRSGRGIRPSKSDTSLTESFVIVDSEYTAGSTTSSAINPVTLRKKPQNSQLQNLLRQGFRWQRQLVFRSKLTMHTAYDRKDNAEPASITSLAVSKDHRTLYVGDARGRVFSWSVTEQPGRGMADHWLKDEGADQCVGCHVR